jgi:hypothetical protein
MSASPRDSRIRNGDLSRRRTSASLSILRRLPFGWISMIMEFVAQLVACLPPSPRSSPSGRTYRTLRRPVGRSPAVRRTHLMIDELARYESGMSGPCDVGPVTATREGGRTPRPPIGTGSRGSAEDDRRAPVRRAGEPRPRPGPPPHDRPGCGRGGCGGRDQPHELLPPPTTRHPGPPPRPPLHCPTSRPVRGWPGAARCPFRPISPAEWILGATNWSETAPDVRLRPIGRRSSLVDGDTPRMSVPAAVLQGDR